MLEVVHVVHQSYTTKCAGGVDFRRSWWLGDVASSRSGGAGQVAWNQLLCFWHRKWMVKHQRNGMLHPLETSGRRPWTSPKNVFWGSVKTTMKGVASWNPRNSKTPSSADGAAGGSIWAIGKSQGSGVFDHVVFTKSHGTKVFSHWFHQCWFDAKVRRAKRWKWG